MLVNYYITVSEIYNHVVEACFELTVKRTL